MFKQYTTEPATTNWASLIVFGPGNDGSLRFYLDYVKSNGITVRDTYPLPRIDDFTDSSGEETIFLTVHENSGYSQIEVDLNSL